MELKLNILTGRRRGRSITLLPDSEISKEIEWVCEDEAIQFVFTVPKRCAKVTLNLYEYQIDASVVAFDEESGQTVIEWNPKPAYNSLEKIFINFFGLAQLSVTFVCEVAQEEVVEFSYIEVLATKVNARNTQWMFDYLSRFSDDVIHSMFRTTSYQGGHEGESDTPPHLTLDHIEGVIMLLQDNLPSLLHHPITKLVQETNVVNATDNDLVNDRSIGWLMSNLSVLNECDSGDDYDIEFENGYYKARSIQVQEVVNNTDIYENQVIHGFLSRLLSDTGSIAENYTKDISIRRSPREYIPNQYESFFNKMNSFKSVILQRQIDRTYHFGEKIKKMKELLNQQMPVRREIRSRPIITPKVRISPTYRTIFREIADWYEQGGIDWSAYNNLFAIKDIPSLFESYCYFRLGESLNRKFGIEIFEEGGEISTSFTDSQGIQVKLHREPRYWMPNNLNARNDTIVNIEGWNAGRYGVKKRKGGSVYSHRRPDIVIELINSMGESNLLIMDAKYTYAKKAFIEYLPKLTMKYVHGIQRKDNPDSTASSLTILYPSESPDFKSFHHDNYSIYGNHPVSPSLQIFGLLSDNGSDGPVLDSFLERLLRVNRVELMPGLSANKN